MVSPRHRRYRQWDRYHQLLKNQLTVTVRSSCEEAMEIEMEMDDVDDNNNNKVGDENNDNFIYNRKTNANTNINLNINKNINTNIIRPYTCQFQFQYE
mmetsp:Transcript_46470/g.51965  ORF Transcript_46470/g.51965 Transcript_46470/m.51965 type:complete len:98 (+) Transcript_46470:669-962(+)